MSKTITIMRHTMAEGGSFQISDADRNMLPEGKRQAQYVASKMQENNLLPDAVWSSAANRARQTAQALIDDLQIKSDITVKDSLYKESNSEVIDEILDNGSNAEHLLIVGHNPQVSNLIAQLSGTNGFGWLATAEMVSLEFDTDKWTDIRTAPIIGRIKISPSN